MNEMRKALATALAASDPVFAPLALDPLTARLAEQAIQVRPAFGLSDHLRVSIGLPEENERFLTGLSQAVGS